MIKGNDGGMFDLCYSVTGYDFYNSKFCFSDELKDILTGGYMEVAVEQP